MPFADGVAVDLHSHGENQAAPVFVSRHGRVVHSDRPFAFEVTAGGVHVEGPAEVASPGTSLRDAVLWAAEHVHHTPRSMPHESMFAPQWALWIELLYEPTEAKTLDYASQVVANGYEPGLLIIDDNWSEDYGRWTFRSDRFPDPAAMVDELHRTGFTVALWVCPYVSPDGIHYLELRDRGLLIREASGEPAIRRWWNGYSAVLDLTNPATVAWFEGQLRELQERYGIDGFKFDGADIDVYRADDVTAQPTSPEDQVHRYGRFAERFETNELRAGWNLGGRGVATRLSDADHRWDHGGIGKLIGNQLALGVMGMPYSAPDMIGGGQYLDFDEDRIDQELFVRHAQIAALSPMMQFSAAPWRLLDDRHAAAVAAAAAIRAESMPDILDLARHAVATGEPIIRPLEYEFPHVGLHEVTDTFMLGADLLVAPVVEPGATQREVALPPGVWESPEGQRFDGGRTLSVAVELDTLIRLRRRS